MRRKVYEIYLRYDDFLKTDEAEWWDECDRVNSIIWRSELQALSCCNGCGSDYDKVYVDEIQDSTQNEVLLFIIASGFRLHGLFLAGDPAQSVVEGVDFRFEEIRSIVHKISDGKERIERPMKLLVNYRSHSGILDCAGFVLELLFKGFPGAAKVLPKDSGLYKGPRPVYSVFSAIEEGEEYLVKLLRSNERLVVLCNDDEAECITSFFNLHEIGNTVLGIRAAKGLEFAEVLILDWFCSTSRCDQKSWKQLIGQSGDVISVDPQLETQLKVLYTGITRSCDRLLFVERRDSLSASAFFRSLK
jgi:superfamily I DNA/RNA helicase